MHVVVVLAWYAVADQALLSHNLELIYPHNLFVISMQC